MNITKTQWPDELAEEENQFAAGGVVMAQPAFGWNLLWNNPKKLHKPCLTIEFWRFHISIGWMFG